MMSSDLYRTESILQPFLKIGPLDFVNMLEVGRGCRSVMCIQSKTLTAIAPIENYHGFYGCGPENSRKHIKTVFLPVTTGETMV